MAQEPLVILPIQIEPLLSVKDIDDSSSTLNVINLEELDNKIKETSKNYADAVYEESAIREVAFLFKNPEFISMPIDIAGIEVHQLTPYHFILLDFVKSPFLVNDRMPDEVHIVDFLWIVSTGFIANNKEAKEKFIKEKCLQLMYDETLKEIYDYLTKAFIDSPAQHVETSKIKKTNIPFYAWVAGYIDILCVEYGWLDSYIMTMPFTKIFQYLKTIESRKTAEMGKEPILFNQYSDRVMKELRKLTKTKSQFKNSVEDIRLQLIREENEHQVQFNNLWLN